MCEKKFGLKLHVGLKDFLLEYEKRTKPEERLGSFFFVSNI